MFLVHSWFITQGCCKGGYSVDPFVAEKWFAVKLWHFIFFLCLLIHSVPPTFSYDLGFQFLSLPGSTCTCAFCRCLPFERGGAQRRFLIFFCLSCSVGVTVKPAAGGFPPPAGGFPPPPTGGFAAPAGGFAAPAGGFASPGASSTPPALTEWAVPQPSKLKYTQLFNSYDRSRSGFLGGGQARTILLQSALPHPVLAQIWSVSVAPGLLLHLLLTTCSVVGRRVLALARFGLLCLGKR